jgi:hypothetical protein
MPSQKRKAEEEVEQALVQQVHKKQKQDLQETLSSSPPPLLPPLCLPYIKKKTDPVPSWKPSWEMGQGMDLMESVLIRLSCGKQYRIICSHGAHLCLHSPLQ